MTENVRHPIDVLHSFSIKNIFCDKKDLRLFYFDEAIFDLGIVSKLTYIPPEIIRKHIVF